MSSRAKLVLVFLSLLFFAILAPKIGKLFRESPQSKLEKKIESFKSSGPHSLSEIDNLYGEARKFNNTEYEKQIIELPIVIDTGVIIKDEWTDEMLSSEIGRLTLPYKNYAGQPYKYDVRTIYQPTKNQQFKKASKIKRETGWSKEICLMITKGQIQIGMNKDQVIKSWGRPTDINRTTYSFGVHEQWVYNYSSYVNFEDGVVTSIQN